MGAGGLRRRWRNIPHGLVDNWLRHVRDIQQRYQQLLAALPSDAERMGRLCELNTVEQVINVGSTTIIHDAWSRGQSLTVHGWIYDVADGVLKDLDVCIASPEDLKALLNKTL